jgi:hypothetical protein
MVLETSPAPYEIPPRRSSFLRSIFIGADGLRAGWSLILFVFLTVAIGKMRFLLMDQLHLTRQSGPSELPIPSPLDAWEVISTRFGIFLDLAIATFLMSRLEGRPLATYGSAGPHRLWRLAGGMLIRSDLHFRADRMPLGSRLSRLRWSCFAWKGNTRWRYPLGGCISSGRSRRRNLATRVPAIHASPRDCWNLPRML